MSADSKKQIRTPKYIVGKLAVCSFCGMSAADFNYCVKCKRKLPENVKAIPNSSSVLPKKENTIPVDIIYKRKRKEPECLTISFNKEVEKQIRTPKYIVGKLAVCSFCGMSAADFNYCVRCKRKLPENVKAIPISSGILPKKKNTVPVDIIYKRKRKEPECLTISSNEKVDGKKQKRLNNSRK